MKISVVIHRWLSNRRIYKKNYKNVRNYNIWIFGEWFGNKCSDNSMYFANYVAAFGDPSLKLYWICNKGVDTSMLNKKIEVIEKSSEKAIDLQKYAGVAVMNQGYDDFSNNGDNYLGNAITVNLWHGVMWKKIGFDAFPKTMLTKIYKITIRKTKNYSLFCSPSDEYKKFFSKAFCIDPSNSISTGLPRNEIFFYENKINKARDKLLIRLNKMGINAMKDTKIIAYMPTFRDENSDSFSFTSVQNKKLKKILIKYNCIIIQKAHEVNVNRGTGYGNTINQRVINIDNIAPQELLAASDILITDYSSCFFDFLLLNRPIIQFVYDYDYYRNKDRGLYYDFNKVDCGAMVHNESKLIDAIEEGLQFPEKHELKRKKVKCEFMKYENKENCRKIYDSIIENIERS